MGKTQQLGGWGEAQALKFLEERGYKKLTVGYRTRFGEIDLIVTGGGYVVFAEVKLRKNREFADAREFVSAAKQKRLRMTAQIWLGSHETELQPRFDVIEVYAPDGVKTAQPEIIHIENAF
ncbi:MAG: YraN family protein [Oscillospiraceae bacterium]|jgi:putative endonuclease|nr:YraN family protein [Oscillospiraceae bacterium]